MGLCAPWPFRGSIVALNGLGAALFQLKKPTRQIRSVWIALLTAMAPVLGVLHFIPPAACRCPRRTSMLRFNREAACSDYRPAIQSIRETPIKDLRSDSAHRMILWSATKSAA